MLDLIVSYDAVDGDVDADTMRFGVKFEDETHEGRKER